MDTRMKIKHLLTKTIRGNIFMPDNQSHIQCLNCGGDASLETERMLNFYTSVVCLECGFRIQPAVSYLSLSELNEYRKAAYDWEYIKEEGCYEPASILLEGKELPSQKITRFDDLFRPPTLRTKSTEVSPVFVEN